jgi:hypothetical protein
MLSEVLWVSGNDAGKGYFVGSRRSTPVRAGMTATPPPSAGALALLELPRDAAPIVGLPPSNAVSLTDLETDALWAVALAFGTMMKPFVVGGPDHGETTALAASLGDEEYARMASRVTEYFFASIFALLNRDCGELEPLLALADSRDRAPAPVLKQGMGVITAMGVLVVRQLEVLVRGNVHAPGSDRQGVKLFLRLINLVGNPDLNRFATSTECACVRLLLYRQAVARMIRFLDEPPSSQTPFSSIDLFELQGLASRQPALASKYGAGGVEKQFEQQLALLMQSLGFYVVRARTGRRQVDLVCISSDPNEQYTILLEAKSTRKPYALPVSDQRALSDYTDDVRRGLVTLPPLRFVLVAAPRAASTVESKLNVLEGEVGVPIRFITAKQLASLRDLLPGPAPAASFRDLALRSDTRVLADDYPTAVAGAYAASQQAHVRFVEALLADRALDSPF